MITISWKIIYGGKEWLRFPDLWCGQEPWWNWDFNPHGEFRWNPNPEGPVSQIHSPHLLLGAPGIFFKVCSDAKERVGCRKQREATAHIQSLVELQPLFLSLRWKTFLRQNCSLGSCACSEGPALGQNTLMMYIYYFESITIAIEVFTSAVQS